MIDGHLQEIGLNEKEAKVYLATLELGKSTVQQIALKAGLKRPTTYVVMEELMQQGLAASFYEGKKQYFVAEDPVRLVELLRQQKQEVEKRQDQLAAILPQLESINNRKLDKPVVKYYEGKEGIQSMVQDCTRLASGQDMYLAYSRDAIASVFDTEALSQMSRYRLNQDVKVRSMYTWKNDIIDAIPNTESLKLTYKDFPIDCDIAIYDDRIRIAALKGRIVGVVIEDKEIAKAFKVLYEYAWNWAKLQKKQ